jgi:hypothetical protein
VRGVSLSDFETFIDNFLAALRDYDRVRRGAHPKKSGHPEQRAKAVTAFRLVKFRPGSGVATLEPDLDERATESLFDEVAPAIDNLHQLIEEFENREPLPPPVTDALERACKSLGADGSIKVELPKKIESRIADITPAALDEIRAKTSAPEWREVNSVSGRLHLLDVEPDKIGIREASGVDWTCQYPEELEHRVLELAGQLVWASGVGRQTSAQRGSMTIDRIEPIDQGAQVSFWSKEPADLNVLAVTQRVRGPQDLSSLGEPEWTEEDDAYLAALTGQ